MTCFVKDLLRKGEDVKTIIILVEAEWPQMAGKVSKAWIEQLR